MYDAEQKLPVERALTLPQSASSINDARKSARMVVMVYKKQAETIAASNSKIVDNIRTDTIYDAIWVKLFFLSFFLCSSPSSISGRTDGACVE